INQINDGFTGDIFGNFATGHSVHLYPVRTASCAENRAQNTRQHDTQAPCCHRPPARQKAVPAAAQADKQGNENGEQMKA
ncbi:MAG TPA: hypothetical protein VFX55_11170, partial [Duganella sp.]|nr:hypothetical protein [Duganella sp.]